LKKKNLYAVIKALKEKNNQVFQTIVKKINNFYLSYSFNLKVKSTKFIYFSSFLIQINNYRLKIYKKKSMPTAETIQKAWMKTIAYAPNPGKISTWMSRNKVENISSHNLKQ
jgi:hypothetical protein